jgi:hypothetical protein
MVQLMRAVIVEEKAARTIQLHPCGAAEIAADRRIELGCIELRVPLGAVASVPGKVLNRNCKVEHQAARLMSADQN